MLDRSGLALVATRVELKAFHLELAVVAWRMLALYEAINGMVRSKISSPSWATVPAYTSVRLWTCN